MIKANHRSVSHVEDYSEVSIIWQRPFKGQYQMVKGNQRSFLVNQRSILSQVSQFDWDEV